MCETYSVMHNNKKIARISTVTNKHVHFCLFYDIIVSNILCSYSNKGHFTFSIY